MNKLFLQNFCLIAILLSASAFHGFSQMSSTWYSNNQQAIDSIRKGNFIIQIFDENNNLIEADVAYSLKKHAFPWGTALDISKSGDDAWYKATARKYFNSGVTENAFKWSAMQPNSAPVNYTDVDRYLAFCDEAGWEMRGHTLIWGSKNYDDFHPLQKWVKDLAVPDMYDTCKLRVQREMAHYKGIIKEYDVLNEAIPGHADWLQKTVGDSINWNCFKWAREADPDANLFINDYNIIAGSDYTKYIKLIQKMLDNAAPIDGIGVQGHFGARVEPNKIKYVLDSLASLGLPVKVTEFDMNVGDNNISELKQAEYYALAMRACFAHPSISGFLFWGFWDARHWRAGAGIFADDKTPKIAADSVYNLIHKTWSTQGVQTVSLANPLKLNGYYGEYEIEVDYKGEKKIIDVSLTKANVGDTILISLAQSKLPAPKIVSAITYDDKRITLQFNMKMKIKGSELNEFKVISNDPHTLSQIWQPTDDSTKIILELSDIINYRSYLTVSYFTGTITGTNGAPLEFIGAYEVENHIPGFISGSTSPDGNLVIMDFTKEMAVPEVTDLNAFQIKVNDTNAQLTEIGIVSGEPKKIYLKLNSPILFGQSVKVFYTPGQIQSADNGTLAAFGPKLISNSLPVGINNIAFDKNNVIAYYNSKINAITISNKSTNKQDYYYSIYTSSGIQLFTSRVNCGEEVNFNTTKLNLGLVIIRFESLSRQINSTTKIIIEK